MKQFFKFTFASILGFFISLLLLFFFFLFFIFILTSTIDSTEKVTLKDNSILELKLDYEVPERSSTLPYFSYSVIPSISKTIGLNDLIESINHAKTDLKIKGIFLNLDNLYIGELVKINEIRNALIDFKSSNKFIIAHGNSISERAFYLASIADSIFITPTGTMEFDGFGIEVTFFKKALDKLEIEPQIFQYGKFKSATEPYKSDRLSNENKLQLNQYLSSVYNKFIFDIAESKSINPNVLKDLSKNLTINSAEDAERYKLVNSLKYKDEVDSLLRRIINIPPKDKLRKVSVKKYLQSFNRTTNSKNRIAIIYATGEIVNSQGDEYSIGTKNIIESIVKARKNKKVKAIVMRINSPGGSPLTSDMIWREIKLASKEKPFIVSLGDIAASGGYYIACAADKIVADSSTLAGSIGVFGIIPNAQKFFNNKLGVTFDRVMTSKNNGWNSYSFPLNNVQKKYIQKQVDDIYVDFVNRVAEGRNMTFDEIDRIAQGRIWSGLHSKEIGLVDTLGGINLALNIAADKAGISDYKIVEYPTQKETFDKIMDLLSAKIEGKFNNLIFQKPLNQINKLIDALKYTGIQTRLPFVYKID